MADSVDIDNGALTDYKVSTDDAGVGGHVQRVKLAYSADGSEVHVPADADGLLVNLGANNDISGTVTANLGATDNAVLDAIAADGDAIQTLLGTIDADTSAIAVDAAAIEVLLGTIDADTSNLAAIAASLALLDNAIAAGNELQVDVVAALPAGTNAIGKLAANSGVDIGDVDVLSIIPGTGATNLGKAEDAAHASGDTGVMALTVRTNTAASRAGTDGDYQPLITDTNGRLHTIEPSQANILTAVQLIDNASVDHDAAVVSGVTQIGLAARSAAPTAVATGDATRALATLLGKQIVYPHALPAETWQYAGPTGGITDTSDDAIQAAGAAGVRHYLANLLVVNAHATVGTEVVIKDGSTVIHRGYAAAAGGGYSLKFDPPLRGTAATALNVACITTGSATVVSASGFSAAE